MGSFRHLFASRPVTGEDMRTEMKRRKSDRNRMLRAFQQYGELNTTQIARYGTGCSSRIKELRRNGHKIVTVRETPSNYRYVYLGKPEND